MRKPDRADLMMTPVIMAVIVSLIVGCLEAPAAGVSYEELPITHRYGYVIVPDSWVATPGSLAYEERREAVEREILASLPLMPEGIRGRGSPSEPKLMTPRR
jgi:hypothetical protein